MLCPVQCKHFGVCGGCTLPGVPYAEQLAKKRKVLSRLLGIDVPPFIPSPAESGFRSKVAFVFGASRETLVMGHYAPASQRIIPVEECPVHHERGNRIAFALRDRLARARIAPGILRHIVIRTTADGREASAMLVVTRNDKSLRAPVKGLLSSPERPDGFFVNIHAKPGPYMVGDETIKIEGRSHVKETVGGMSYLVSPTAFFQTNVGAAEILVKLVVEAVGQSATRPGPLLRKRPVLAAARKGRRDGDRGRREPPGDCGCGVQRQAQSSAARPGPVHRRARRGRARAGRQGSVGRRRPRSTAPGMSRRQSSRPCSGGFGPRASSMCPAVPIRSRRNCRLFSTAATASARVQPVDMFPHTDHIETVMTFERGPLR